MIRIITVFALALFVGTAHAQAGAFVGIGLGNSKLSYDYSDDFFDDSGSDSESDTLLYVRGGAEFGNNIRAYGTLSKVGYEGLDQLSVTASVDKLFPINQQFYFYAGGSLGYTSLDFDDFGKESGILAGAQGGVFYRVTPAIGVDAGLSYMMTNAEFKETEVIPSGIWAGSYETKIEFKSVTAFKIGVDYKF